MNRFSVFFLAAAVLLLSSSSFPAERKPIEIKKDDKCRVCGMFVAHYKEWIAQIIFSDGTYAVFDGPKDMTRYYNGLAKYNPSKKQSDIAAVYVTEYYSARLMDARKMFYVSGSDVSGPMGQEFIPVDTEKKAREFMQDHGGKKILRFPELSREALE